MTMDVHLHRLVENADRAPGSNGPSSNGPGSAIFLPRESFPSSSGPPIRHKRSFDVAFLTGQDTETTSTATATSATASKKTEVKQQDIPGSAFTKVAKCEDVRRAVVSTVPEYPVGFSHHPMGAHFALPFALQHAAVPGKGGFPLFGGPPPPPTPHHHLLNKSAAMLFPKERHPGSTSTTSTTTTTSTSSATGKSASALMENYLKTQQALYKETAEMAYPANTTPSAFQTSALASKLRPALYPDLYNFAPYSYLTLGSELAAASRPPLLPPSPVSTLLPPSLTALTLPAQNVCAKCNVGFRMTSDLVYHMRSHHKRETDPLKRKREDKLKCPVCNESFRERHHLTRHMTAHQDKEEDGAVVLNK